MVGAMEASVETEKLEGKGEEEERCRSTRSRPVRLKEGESFQRTCQGSIALGIPMLALSCC